jgi:hypothetical protein
MALADGLPLGEDIDMRLRNTCVVLGTLLTLTSAGCFDGDDGEEGGQDAAAQSGSVPPDAASVTASADAGAADAAPLHAYGEFCVKNADCASEFCYEAACTLECDISAVNSCRDVDAFCVPTGNKSGCFGHVETGSDTDGDQSLALGAQVVTKLMPAGDADLFEIALDAGHYEISATPAPDGNVALEVYSELTKMDAAADLGGLGVEERATLAVPRAGRYFVVVRDVAGAPANVTVIVKPAL